MYLENGFEFSPVDFLTILNKNQLLPNRVTYQLLVAAYCEKGDINGAMKILEFMKAGMVSINELVFCSLIVGHFEAG